MCSFVLLSANHTVSRCFLHYFISWSQFLIIYNKYRYYLCIVILWDDADNWIRRTSSFTDARVYSRTVSRRLNDISPPEDSLRRPLASHHTAVYPHWRGGYPSFPSNTTNYDCQRKSREATSTRKITRSPLFVLSTGAFRSPSLSHTVPLFLSPALFLCVLIPLFSPPFAAVVVLAAVNKEKLSKKWTKT